MLFIFTCSRPFLYHRVMRALWAGYWPKCISDLWETMVGVAVVVIVGCVDTPLLYRTPKHISSCFTSRQGVSSFSVCVCVCVCVYVRARVRYLLDVNKLVP